MRKLGATKSQPRGGHRIMGPAEERGFSRERTQRTQRSQDRGFLTANGREWTRIFGRLTINPKGGFGRAIWDRGGVATEQKGGCPVVKFPRSLRTISTIAVQGRMGKAEHGPEPTEKSERTACRFDGVSRYFSFWKYCWGSTKSATKGERQRGRTIWGAGGFMSLIGGVN